MNFQGIAEISNLLQEPHNETQKIFKDFLKLMQNETKNQLKCNFSNTLPHLHLEEDGTTLFEEFYSRNLPGTDESDSDKKSSGKSDINPIAQEVFNFASSSNFNSEDEQFNLQVTQLAAFLRNGGDQINEQYKDVFNDAFASVIRNDHSTVGKIARVFSFSIKTALLVKTVSQKSLSLLFKHTTEFVEDNIAYLLTGNGGWGSAMNENNASGEQ